MADPARTALFLRKGDCQCIRSRAKVLSYRNKPMNRIDWRHITATALQISKKYWGALGRQNIVALFFLAVVCGFFIKTSVHDSLTIGFDDYRLSTKKDVVDLNLLQKELIQQGGSFATGERPTLQGESCSISQ